MRNFFKKIVENKFFITILVLGGILRFYNLGYSDFQGDEIKAFFLPEEGQNVITYLLEQRKGPLQFLITYSLKYIDPNYENQLLMRFPFALAGFISIYFFYKWVKDMYGEKMAFYTSFFFATNGFLIAFSRIVQYQSLVIMFMIGSLYFLKRKQMFWGLLFWALSILAHYDGLFIFPLAFYYIYLYLTDITEIKPEGILNIGKLKLNKKYFWNFIFSGIVATALLAAFYVPFVINLSEKTQDYWAGRITGGVSAKKSSSLYLFTVYQPIYIIHIYLGLFALGIITLITDIFKKTTKKETVTIAIWTLIAVLFMEALIYIPGTHIYVYLIPGMIFCALGITLIENIVTNILKIKALFILGVTIIFAFVYLQTHAIYVDNTQEYPWEEEKFFIWTFPKPTPAYHLSMFGFPYFRDWEGIKSFIESYPLQQAAYSTNERTTISRRYVTLPKESNEAGFYIHIRNPQSFEDEVTHEKVSYWMSKYNPIYVFNKDGKDKVNIYLMEPGGKEVIVTKGF